MLCNTQAEQLNLAITNMPCKAMLILFWSYYAEFKENWELVLQSSCGQSHLMSVVMIFVHVKIGKLCLIQATCQVSRLHSDTNTKFKY